MQGFNAVGEWLTLQGLSTRHYLSLETLFEERGSRWADLTDV